MKKVIAIKLISEDPLLNDDHYKIQYLALKNNLQKLEEKGIHKFLCLGHSFAWVTKQLNTERQNEGKEPIPILPISGRTIDKETHDSLPIMNTRNRKLFRKMLSQNNILAPQLLKEKITIYDMSHEVIGLKCILKEIKLWIEDKLPKEKHALAISNFSVLTFQPQKDKLTHNLNELLSPFKLEPFILPYHKQTAEAIKIEQKIESACDSDNVRLFFSNKISNNSFEYPLKMSALIHEVARKLKDSIINKKIYSSPI